MVCSDNYFALLREFFREDGVYLRAATAILPEAVIEVVRACVDAQQTYSRQILGST